MTLQTLNRDEADFLPLAQSVQAMPASSAWSITLRVLAVLAVVALVWLMWARTDVVVKAQGRLVTQQRLQAIAAPDTAVVKAIHVRDGQQVREGDLLIELDTETLRAEHTKARELFRHAHEQAMVAQSIRPVLHCLLNAYQAHPQPATETHASLHCGTPVLLTSAEKPDPLAQSAIEADRSAAAETPRPVFDLQRIHLPDHPAPSALLQTQWQDVQARLQQANADIKRHAGHLPLLTARASDFKRLLEAGFVSSHAWLEREQLRLDTESQLNLAIRQRSSLLARILREVDETWVQARRALTLAQQDIVRLAHQIDRLQLHSPVSGTIQQLSVHTRGGVVPAAQTLMRIAPAGSALEVEAFLSQRDIGFVKEGQSASIRFDAYDYARFGAGAGIVRHVSRDAIDDPEHGLVYAIRLSLVQSQLDGNGSRLVLGAGLAATIDIRVGERPILDYLLSPLIRHRHEAFREF